MNDDEALKSTKEFYDLDVWKKARILRNSALRLIRTFPSDEKFALSDQIKRAARSIAACIAEGHGRFTYKDQVHFCIMARGSVTELLNHFIDAYDQGYLSKQTLTEQKCLTQQVHKMLNGYIQYLRVQQKRSCTAKGK